MRLLGLIVVLLVLAVGGLAGYAYLGDMKAAPTEMRVPVELDLGAGQPSAPADPATPAESPAAAEAPAEAVTEPAPAGAATGETAPQSQANDLD